jgi:hypothetical protein
MTNAEKVLENRMRRVAARRGFRLVKIRRRDRRAIDYGQFMLVPEHGAVRGAAKGPLTIAQVERWAEG